MISSQPSASSNRPLRLVETEVSRLRLGIGRPPRGWDTADYVLGKFTKQEIDTFEQATTDAAHAALDWACSGIAYAMNRHNADPAAKQKKKQNNKLKTHSPNQTPAGPKQGNPGGD